MCRILTNSVSWTVYLLCMDVFYLCLPQCVAKNVHRWQFRLLTGMYLYYVMERLPVERSENYHLTGA